TVSASRLTNIAAHENHRTLRFAIESTIGPIIRTPPRNRISTKTIEAPLKLKASVVVPIIVAMQRPDRKVQIVGKGSLSPNNSRRPANFHQRMTLIKPSIPATEATAEIGNSSKPDTGSLICDSRPLVSALVRPL